MGQIIQATSWMNDNHLEIDVKKLPPGSYYLMLNVDGAKRVFPLIKQ